MILTWGMGRNLTLDGRFFIASVFIMELCSENSLPVMDTG